MATFLYGTSNFGKIYGGHTFEYRRPPGPTARKANGIELDLEISREPLPENALEDRIAAIYGVRAEMALYTDFDVYWEICMRALTDRVPVIIEFDLRFIKGRREYGKLDNPHAIVLCGYDPRAQVFTAAEQMVGTISVTLDDFRNCFRHITARRTGGVRVLTVTRVNATERALRREEVLEQIDANIENLTSSNEKHGFKAIARFRADIEEYVRSKAFQGQPFAIPGLWVFSHERHILRKWLKAIEHLVPERGLRVIEDFDVLLSRTFKRWLNTDFLIEKCLITGNGSPLASIPKYLDLVLPDEAEALERWLELQKLVSRD